MINRSARRLEDPNARTPEQGTPRKFGNIANRLEKSVHTFPSKKDGGEKYGGLQNQAPLPSYPQDQRYTDYNQKTYQINPYGMPPPEQKKECNNRNRQFVAKVENINKIHDQINNLLKYVKNDQCKSLLKQKQPTRMREDETLRNTPKQRVPEQKFKLRKQEFIHNRLVIDTNSDDHLISPVTQHQEAIKTTDRNLERSYHMRHQQQYQQIERLNPQDGRKTLGINYHLNSNEKSGMQVKRNLSKLNFNNQNVLNSEGIKKRNYDDIKSPSQRVSSYRIDEKHSTPQKSQKKQQNLKKNYCYNFQSGSVPQELKSQQKTTQMKMEKSTINYDYQIEKVKERIQSSEQMTKRMEQKYLNSNQKSSIEEGHRHRGVVQTFEVDDKNKSQEQARNRNRWERKSYIIPQTPQGNFQIQVYPCTIEQQKLRKDEVNRMIADKLSEQIKLDQKLRDARQLFHQLKAVDKWQSLQGKLKNLGYSFNQLELQNQLSINSSETNPFSVDSSKISNCIQELADTFARSEEFWEKKLRKFMSRRTVENSEFNPREMDLDQRGYLSVEDLVCFVNLYTSNFFRNRDIICLFRRMSALGRNRNGVDYDDFLKIICHQ